MALQRGVLRREWPMLVGLAVLSASTVWRLLLSLLDPVSPGPGFLILLVVAWLFRELRANVPSCGADARIGGWGMILLGLVLFVLGRTQSVWALESSAFIAVLSGWLMLEGGVPWLRHFWFPLCYMLFLVPQTGAIDWLTAGLRIHVSGWAEMLGYAFGYPVARAGVLLYIGQYQLLVEDACSGMNSLFSLSALGVLYLFFQRHKNPWCRVLVLLCIFPVSIVANVMRVFALILLTYYWGDAAGQGVMHQFAGLFLFVVALAMLHSIDQLLTRCWPKCKESA